MNASAPGTDRLDRHGVVPLYFQLQELLKEKLELGVWSPGEAIPPELELCATHAVSRTVVRQALAILEQDGQITRTRGRGTFVSPPKVEQRAGGLSRLLAAPGAESDVTILDRRSQPASRRIAEAQMDGLRRALPRRLLAVYRVDRVQFHLELAPDGVAAQATWQLAEAR